MENVPFTDKEPNHTLGKAQNPDYFSKGKYSYTQLLNLKGYILKYLLPVLILNCAGTELKYTVTLKCNRKPQTHSHHKGIF